MAFPKLDTSKLISMEKREQLDSILEPLILTDKIVEKMKAAFWEQVQLANSTDESVRKKSDHLMMNTFVRELLDGDALVRPHLEFGNCVWAPYLEKDKKLIESVLRRATKVVGGLKELGSHECQSEQGDYLGLDLGGTNFRVVLVRFKDGVADTVTTYYTLREEILCGPAAGVFDFIAESIKDFLQKNELMESKTKLPLGFTFSFPSTQLALNKSILLTWTKTFRCPDGVGDDPVHMLEQAIERKAKNLPVDVVVVMSDTVSTLMAGNYLDKNCRVGLILGTGCNAAFVENIEDIEKWTGDYQDPKHVIVNVELGSTGDGGCMDFARSEYEKEVDKFSNHPGSFTFEKSFSGMYLGELIRLVLVRLVQEETLFGGDAPQLVKGRWKLSTAHVTKIESDVGGNTTNTRNVLDHFGLSSASEQDIAIVREVCEFMSKRGAHIIAIAMSVLINYIKLPEVTIGIDGSLYEKHPKFHKNMTEIFHKLCPDTKVKMILAKDGSGQGAAFAAVSALKQVAKGIRCS